MNIFFCSKESNGGDMALRLEMEGHKVKFHLHNDEEMKNLDGLIEKEKNWRSGVRWSDFVVFDDTGMDDVTAYVKASKKPAFGMGFNDATVKGKKIVGNEVQSVLEKDRTFSQSLMRDLKIGEPIESLQFSNLDEAVKHLKEHRVPHVIKPEVTGSGSEKTYVGEKDDGEDAIGWLETLPQRPSAGKIKKIEVEERIKGVEVAASSWFNGKDFIGCNINFEHKRIAAGEIGFNTGEMGTAMFYDSRPSSSNKLFRDTVYKMGDFLRDVDYRGQIDINCIVRDGDIFGLEFTPRLGYPSSYIEDELQDTPWGEMLYAIAKGENLKPRFSNDWAIGVVLVGEGYPFWDEGHKRMDGMPIIGLDENSIDHTHFYDVEYKDDRFLTTGCYPVVATARGKTLEEAQKNVYDRTIPKVFFPSMYYRIDIGERVVKDLAKLKSWGIDLGRER